MRERGVIAHLGWKRPHCCQPVASPAAQRNANVPADYISRAQSFPPNHFLTSTYWFVAVTYGLDRYIHPIHKSPHFLLHSELFMVLFFVLLVFFQNHCLPGSASLYIYTIILVLGIHHDDFIFKYIVKWSQ